jgi:hypothetical protein
MGRRAAAARGVDVIDASMAVGLAGGADTVTAVD